MDELRFLVETYLDYQKDRIRFDNRVRSLPEEYRKSTFFETLSEYVHGLEKKVAERITELVEEDPLYTRYLKYQKGVGPIMSGYLIAWLCRDREVQLNGIVEKVGSNVYKRKWKKQTTVINLPPYTRLVEENIPAKYIVVCMPPVMRVATNPSKLHKYCGLTPGSKMRRGSPTSFNPKVKTLMYKIFMQLLKAKGEWYNIYLRDKEEYAKRCPKTDKGSLKLKVHLTAKNIVMRKFMTNLWLVYRWMHGLPTTEPYPVKLGLQHEILRPFIETEQGVKFLSEKDFKAV